jgi:uncharacterized protein (TIGR00645 family)
VRHEKITAGQPVGRIAGPGVSQRVESALEAVLFGSRWLMAPFYLLMVAALCMLLVKFGQETWHIVTHTLSMTESDAVLAVLSLIDITLTGNLLLMVLFAGYENFVSKMDVNDHPDRPEWMGKVDFAGLKLKLIASIVAISGINLLKNFMALDGLQMTPGKEQQLFWMVVIHLVFIASGVMLAVMDKIVAVTGPRH